MSLSEFTGNRRAIAVIAAAASLIVVLVGVRGNFPLSDDWSYAYAARSLCESGRVELLPWSGTSLVFQAAYGALLCKLFGFSFVVLRASTLVIAVLGVIGFHALARQVGLRGQSLGIATAVFGLCPLYLNLAFTYMTDVPATATLVWAAFFYARGIRRLDATRILYGAVLCSASFLIRQQAIVLAFAAAGQLLLMSSSPRRKRFLLAACAVTLPLAATAAYAWWIFAGHGMTPAVSKRAGEIALLGVTTIADVTFRSIETIGLVIFPLGLALVSTQLRPLKRDYAVALGVLSVCALYLYLTQRDLMFYLGNVLYDLGVGSLTSRDTLFLGLQPPLHAGFWFELAATILATITGAILVVFAIRMVFSRREQAQTLLLLTFAFMFCAGILLQGRLYLDRHLLPVLPFAILIVALSMRTNMAAAWACTALLAWWSIAGTHDYMAWNRARFEMLDALESAGTDPRSIDGGVEYNGWRLAHDLGTWPTTEEARPGQPATKRSWWWVVDDRYVVTFRSLEGYALKAQRQYQRWLIPGRSRVLLLERIEPPPA